MLHTFAMDFYGEELRLAVCGYLRPEQNYPSLDALVKAIHDDIATASRALDTAEYGVHAADPVLLPTLQ